MNTPREGWEQWDNWVPGDPIPGNVLPPDPPSKSHPQPPPDAAQRRGLPPPVTATPVGTGGGRAVIAVLALAMLAVGIGAVVVFAIAGSTSTDSGEVGVVPRPTTAGGFDPGGDPAEPADPEDPEAPLDLIGVSAVPGLEALRDVVGDRFRLASLVLYPEYLVAEIEPPNEPGVLDRWVVYPGDQILGPDPVMNVAADPDSDWFWSDEVPFEAVASLAERAAGELAIADGAVTHVYVSRSVFHDGALTLNVYVTGARQTGYVAFSAAGEVLAVHG